MRKSTLDLIFAMCEPEHDRECVDGAGCADRVKHIQHAYMPLRMAALIDEFRDLGEPTEDCGSCHLVSRVGAILRAHLTPQH